MRHQRQIETLKGDKDEVAERKDAAMAAAAAITGHLTDVRDLE